VCVHLFFVNCHQEFNPNLERFFLIFQLLNVFFDLVKKNMFYKKLLYFIVNKITKFFFKLGDLLVEGYSNLTFHVMLPMLL